MSDFENELRQLINRFSLENHSNTPDFILAQYVNGMLSLFGETLKTRDAWHGIKPLDRQLNLKFKP